MDDNMICIICGKKATEICYTCDSILCKRCNEIVHGIVSTHIVDIT